MRTLVLKHLLIIVAILFASISSSQNVTIPDNEFKQALLNYSPRIDTNFDYEISITEAAAITTLDISYHHREEHFMPDPNDPFGFGGGIFIQEGIYDFTGIEAFVNLTSLTCIENDLTTLDVSALTQLAYLDCTNNRNPMGFNGGITNLILPNSTSLSQLKCSINYLTSLDLSSYTSLTEINIASNNLTNLTLPTSSTLQNINCSYNNLTTLNLLNTPNINQLICFNNSLNILDTSNLSVLTHLTTSNNNIVSLNLTQNVLLSELNCSGNNLTNLDLSQNTALTSLRCNSNVLTSLDVSNNQSLTTLVCNTNQITNLDVSNLSSLSQLLINNNLLTSLNLKNGNNSAITSNWFDARSNPNLNLICVDDIGYANSTFTKKDAQSYYADICSFIPTNSNTITGTVSFDFNLDGCDPLDSKSTNTKLTNTSTNTSNVTFTNNNGQYLMYSQEASNTVDIFPNLPSFFSVTPTTQNVNFTGSGTTQNVDFCITANSVVNDVKVSILPLTESRPGFQTTVRVFYENLGSTILSGAINLTFDDSKEVFISTSEATSNQTSSSLSWNYTNLNPFEKKYIDVVFEINRPTDLVNPVNNGDVLSYNCTINPTTGDVNPTDNTTNYDDITIGSYDPNDIIALEGNFIDENEVPNYLNYRIRFQNTGTASAINIVVKNELDSDLDWDTFEPITASHDYRISITDNNKIDFIFENIHLADSTSNEPGSHGWIYYKIKPKSSFAIGDVIDNTANIYFDFNPPVITNTYQTQIPEPIVTPIDDLIASIYPNPARDIANIEVNLKGRLFVYNKYGALVFKHRLKKGVNTFNFDWLRSGRYFLKIKSKKQVIYKKLIKKKNGRGHGSSHHRNKHSNSHGKHCKNTHH